MLRSPVALLVAIACACGSSSTALDGSGPTRDGSNGLDDAPPGIPDALATTATNFARPGPLGVSVGHGTLALTECSLSYVLYTPEGRPDAPLVVLGHGFARSASNQADLAQHLASFGVRVATPGYCHSSFLDADHAQNAADAVALAASLRAGAPVLYAGHSAGGLSAVLASSSDSSAVAVLGLDLTDVDDLGLSAAASMTLPTLGLVADTSSCNASGNGRTVLVTVPSAFRVHVLGANHCDFEGPTNFVCTAPCGEPRAERVEVVKALAAAFVAWKMGLDPSGESWVTPAGAQFMRLASEGAVEALP